MGFVLKFLIHSSQEVSQVQILVLYFHPNLPPVRNQHSLLKVLKRHKRNKISNTSIDSGQCSVYLKKLQLCFWVCSVRMKIIITNLSGSNRNFVWRFAVNLIVVNIKKYSYLTVCTMVKVITVRNAAKGGVTTARASKGCPFATFEIYRSFLAG